MFRVGETLVTIPDHSALASFRFDDDIANLSPRAFYRFRKLKVNAFVSQRLKTKATLGIGAKASRISGPHSKRCSATIADAVWPPAPCLCSISRVFVSERETPEQREDDPPHSRQTQRHQIVFLMEVVNGNCTVYLRSSGSHSKHENF